MREAQSTAAPNHMATDGVASGAGQGEIAGLVQEVYKLHGQAGSFLLISIHVRFSHAMPF